MDWHDPTNDAFEVLRFIAAKRLAAGKLMVVDATNVQPESRKPRLNWRWSFTACRWPLSRTCRSGCARSETKAAPTATSARTLSAKRSLASRKFALGIEVGWQMGLTSRRMFANKAAV